MASGKSQPSPSLWVPPAKPTVAFYPSGPRRFGTEARPSPSSPECSMRQGLTPMEYPPCYSKRWLCAISFHFLFKLGFLGLSNEDNNSLLPQII